MKVRTLARNKEHQDRADERREEDRVKMWLSESIHSLAFESSLSTFARLVQRPCVLTSLPECRHLCVC